jgi:hypothetical protein
MDRLYFFDADKMEKSSISLLDEAAEQFDWNHALVRIKETKMQWTRKRLIKVSGTIKLNGTLCRSFFCDMANEACLIIRREQF